MARVVLDHLTKKFDGARGDGWTAVSEVSLTVEDRELMVLVGPSGAGKSTLLRLIAGLEEVTHGTISLDGQIVNQLPPKDRDIAMVFQNLALYPHLTASENMALGLKLRKLPRAEIEPRVNAAADLLGLRPCLKRLPRSLSGGERQRVALGRAIVRQPKVFLFDEPLSNLDAPMRVQMRAELIRLHKQLAATMIYVTHDQAEAMTLGDRIVVLNQGVIQQVAAPMELYRHPANLFVAGFVGSPPMNFAAGILVSRGDTLTFVGHPDAADSSGDGLTVRLTEEQSARLQKWQDRQVVLGLRPEAITLHTATIPDAATSIAATVKGVEPLGADTFVHLTVGSQALIARVASKLRARVGDSCRLEFEMAQAHFFDPAGTLVI